MPCSFHRVLPCLFGIIILSNLYGQLSDTTQTIKQAKGWGMIYTDSIFSTDSSANNSFINKKNLFNLITKPNKHTTDSTNKKNENSYSTYDGLVIKNINIIQLKTFGQEVYDTSQKTENWFQKAGNKTHIKTYEIILRNRLLLSEGDKIDPVLLADNERLLRDLPYIQDARIDINYDSLNTDSVGIDIIVKDKYPVAFSFEAYDAQYGKIGLWNKNIFGTGHEMYLQSIYNINRAPNLTLLGHYKIHNIYNTQISSSFSYEKSWDKKKYEVLLKRDFITPETKYAGGINYTNLFHIRSQLLKDTIYENIHLKYNYYDVWLGRSFSILPYRNYFNRTNLYVNVRYTNYNFLQRPIVQEKSFYNYHNRQIFLSSIGIAEQGYFKTKLVYGFGDTEDIPFGKNLNFIFGYEQTEFKQRYYSGIEIAAGGYFPGLGYLYNQARVSSFYNNNQLEQGLVNYQFNYFSPVFGINRYLFRYYFSASFTGGFNRYHDEYFNLEKNRDIRGLSNAKALARQELILNSELVLFSPHYIFGFRFVYFMFFDAGLNDFENQNIFETPIYTGSGIGVRIRNNRLVFNTIQFRLAYFPTAPPNSNYEYLQLIGVGSRRSKNFTIDPPFIYPFEEKSR